MATTLMKAMILLLFGWTVIALGVAVDQVPLGHSRSSTAFTASGIFPTSAAGFKSYYNDPTATASQPQPVVSDPVSNKTYPFSLTDPKSIPSNNTHDPHPLPPKASGEQLRSIAFAQIVGLARSSDEDGGLPALDENSCAKCIAGLEVGKFVALAAPEEVPQLLVSLCEHFEFTEHCRKKYDLLGVGSVITQVLANTDAGGYDGQLICHNFLKLCPAPAPSPLDLNAWFAKPKPDPLPPPRKSRGRRVKVLHVSDFHLDPRYETGAEADCHLNMCCRHNSPFADAESSTPQFPAPRFGAFKCDTPYSLALAALQAIPALSETQETGFAWSIYTGDIVSHDPENQLSRDYVMYTETVVFDLFKRFIGNGSLYATLGNHDTYNQAQDAPHSIGPPLADQFSWNHEHVARLWEHENWLPSSAVEQAKTHYGGYSVRREDGLRVISLNTDMWYTHNYFNYINTTSGDNSGMLRFLTDELQDAEDVGDRVWIIGHVLSGWDGTEPLVNPTNLFYQIVDRYSPHVIANIFFGHTHEDHFSIFYTNNGTAMNHQTAQTVSWVGPSITPMGDRNTGFRVYEVDSDTFDILDSYTYVSDVSTYSDLDSQTMFGPVFSLEYSTREAYGQNISGWSLDDPLNATWWHLVTEQFESTPSLVDAFAKRQSKSSIQAENCTVEECVEAKICYMRSGSASIAKANCIPGFK